MPTYLWALLASALPAFVAGYSLGAARHVSSRTGAPSAVGVASNAFRMLRTRGGQMQTAVSVKDAGLCKKLEVPSELLDSVDIFIFDCDGVIWKGVLNVTHGLHRFGTFLKEIGIQTLVDHHRLARLGKGQSLKRGLVISAHSVRER